MGRTAGLHYIRTKGGAEVDFALSDDGQLTHLIECKWGDDSPHRSLSRFAELFPTAEAVQIIHDLRQEEVRKGIRMTDAASWLAGLAV